MKEFPQCLHHGCDKTLTGRSCFCFKHEADIIRKADTTVAYVVMGAFIVNGIGFSFYDKSIWPILCSILMAGILLLFILGVTGSPLIWDRFGGINDNKTN